MVYAEYVTLKIHGLAISHETGFVLYWLAIASKSMLTRACLPGEQNDDCLRTDWQLVTMCLSSSWSVHSHCLLEWLMQLTILRRLSISSRADGPWRFWTLWSELAGGLQHMEFLENATARCWRWIECEKVISLISWFTMPVLSCCCSLIH